MYQYAEDVQKEERKNNDGSTTTTTTYSYRTVCALCGRGCPAGQGMPSVLLFLPLQTLAAWRILQ